MSAGAGALVGLMPCAVADAARHDLVWQTRRVLADSGCSTGGVTAEVSPVAVLAGLRRGELSAASVAVDHVHTSLGAVDVAARLRGVSRTRGVKSLAATAAITWNDVGADLRAENVAAHQLNARVIGANSARSIAVAIDMPTYRGKLQAVVDVRLVLEGSAIIGIPSRVRVAGGAISLPPAEIGGLPGMRFTLPVPAGIAVTEIEATSANLIVLGRGSDLSRTYSAAPIAACAA